MYWQKCRFKLVKKNLSLGSTWDVIFSRWRLWWYEWRVTTNCALCNPHLLPGPGLTVIGESQQSLAHSRWASILRFSSSFHGNVPAVDITIYVRDWLKTPLFTRYSWMNRCLQRRFYKLFNKTFVNWILSQLIFLKYTFNILICHQFLFNFPFNN